MTSAVGLWLFCSELTRNYLPSVRLAAVELAQAILFVLLVVMLVWRSVRVIRSSDPRKVVCGGVALISIALSLWFRSEFFLLGDRFFFWVNEASFRKVIAAESAVGRHAVVVHQWSSGNFRKKMFVYSRSPSGIGGDWSVGCELALRSIRTDIHVVNVYC